MKVYKVELMVVDYDGLGGEGIQSEIENTHYANHCMSPKVMACESRDIGEWSDDHLLNNKNKSEAEYHRLFSTDIEPKERV